MFSYFATEIEKCVRLRDNHALGGKAKYDYRAGNIFFPVLDRTLQNFDSTFLRWAEFYIHDNAGGEI